MIELCETNNQSIASLSFFMAKFCCMSLVWMTRWIKILTISMVLFKTRSTNIFNQNEKSLHRCAITIFLWLFHKMFYLAYFFQLLTMNHLRRINSTYKIKMFLLNIINEIKIMKSLSSMATKLVKLLEEILSHNLIFFLE